MKLLLTLFFVSSLSHQAFAENKNSVIAEAIEYGDCISPSITEAKLRAILQAKKKCGGPVLRVSNWERFQRSIYCINEGVRAEFQCVSY